MLTMLYVGFCYQLGGQDREIRNHVMTSLKSPSNTPLASSYRAILKHTIDPLLYALPSARHASSAGAANDNLVQG